MLARSVKRFFWKSVWQHNGERAAPDPAACLDLGHRHVLRTHLHGDPGVQAPRGERIGRLGFGSVTATTNDVECQAALILVDVLGRASCKWIAVAQDRRKSARQPLDSKTRAVVSL